jgi:hypothetical protein
MTTAQRTALEAINRFLVAAEQYELRADDAGRLAAVIVRDLVPVRDALLAPTPGETAPCGCTASDECRDDACDCECHRIEAAAPPPAEAPSDADAAYAEECRQAAAWYRQRAAPPDLVALVRECQDTHRIMLEPISPGQGSRLWRGEAFGKALRDLLAYPLGERPTEPTP